ncbi:hypothetical protein CERSUDRAFT_93325 [Gelatoporia subvermispora B]|uniref:BTB domain-containing protein n=1 Tax=Ceriporiopsis subvermispora (strain B) TaxID=914234 RepID=M2R403_CERS8|nr:hypothetical protein CERSUDRAFT_93325 [Gelatoporia subvermispora B]
MSFTEAAPPFDKASNIPAVDNVRPPADLGIRSRDGVKFHVHKSILSVASQTFAAMLYSADKTNDNEEPITLEEDKRTLDALFCAYYPLADPELEYAEDVFNVTKASKKYMMEHAEQVAYRVLMSSDFLELDPFSVFSIACHFNLKEEARKAARHTQMCHPPSYAPVALWSAGGQNVWNLLAYGRRYKEAIWSALEEREFWDFPMHTERYTTFFCQACYPIANKIGILDDMCGPCGLSWNDYRRLSMEILRPLSYSVSTEDDRTQLKKVLLLEAKPEKLELNCLQCRVKAVEVVGDFVDALAREIKNIVSLVELELHLDE